VRRPQASLRQAEQIRRVQTERSDAVVQRLTSALERIASLVQQVITQTDQRVLHGESVPASSKLVSLFEAHTAIVGVAKLTYRQSSVALIADRGFSTLENEQLARDLHIRSVAYHARDR
jgi:hypothetical protein